MNPSRPFIPRPVGTTLLMAAILPVGISSYRFLPISALPEVDYPTIQVQTFLPGASPEVMTTSVTAPLERQFGQMPGLGQMSSISSGGASVVTLQFVLSLNLDIAEQEVQAAINLPAPPIYSKVNPADTPILTLALTSKTVPLTEIGDKAASTARCRAPPSTPTTRSTASRATATSSSPTRTAGRSAWAISPPSWTARRTTSSPPGPTAPRPSS